MNCKICGYSEFDKEGRVWTCQMCHAEHVMSKDLKECTSVHASKQNIKYAMEKDKSVYYLDIMKDWEEAKRKRR